MSTWVYLVCLDHDPPLQSEGESGQHLTDLPEIRSDIALREKYVALSSDDVYGEWWDSLHHFRRNSVRFLREHPRCHIGIRDEYGVWHPSGDDTPMRSK